MTSRLVVTALTDDECWARLRSTDLGRLAVSVRALPVILPVYYRVVERSTVFRTAPGTKLAAATARAVVALEADGTCTAPGAGAGAGAGAHWSVVAQGMAEVVTDPDRLSDLRLLGLTPVGAAGQLDHFVTISVQIIAGRRAVTAEAGS